MPNSVQASLDLHHTKHLRQTPNAWHFRFALNLVFTAQWFRFGGWRCSLLNTTLILWRIYGSSYYSTACLRIPKSVLFEARR
ncbi:hypothetical protein F7Q89_18075 [Vibrio kanaloae]|nr:hypothetical protein F7Q89_18075 [Vibrio kanaloae]